MVLRTVTATKWDSFFSFRFSAEIHKHHNMEQNNWQGGRLLLAYVLAPDLEAGKGAAAAFCGR